jgi:hypothetical protein
MGTPIKVALSHREQTCREMLVRIYSEKTYSKEFIEQHIKESTPQLLTLLERHEKDVTAYLADRLMRYAQSCDLDKTKFHLPCNESKLRMMFANFLDGWRDTD